PDGCWWRTHSCVPCRHSCRHRGFPVSRGVGKSKRRSLRERLWRHKPRIGLSFVSNGLRRGLWKVPTRHARVRAPPSGHSSFQQFAPRFVESVDTARTSACATSGPSSFQRFAPTFLETRLQFRNPPNRMDSRDSAQSVLEELCPALVYLK